MTSSTKRKRPTRSRAGRAQPRTARGRFAKRRKGRKVAARGRK